MSFRLFGILGQFNIQSDMAFAFFVPASPVGNGRRFGKRPAAVGDAWLCLVQDLAEVASISYSFLS